MGSPFRSITLLSALSGRFSGPVVDMIMSVLTPKEKRNMSTSDVCINPQIPKGVAVVGWRLDILLALAQGGEAKAYSRSNATS